MKNLRNIFMVLCLFACGTAVQAQSAMASAGGKASGGSGSLTYTIGQLVYWTDQGIDCDARHGIQLPYEILWGVGIDDHYLIDLQCLVYPNPTSNNVKLRIENFRNEQVRFELYDIQGKLLQNQKVIGSETMITMSNLLPAVYFLKVIEHNTAVKSFKVIKNY